MTVAAVRSKQAVTVVPPGPVRAGELAGDLADQPQSVTAAAGPHLF